MKLKLEIEVTGNPWKDAARRASVVLPFLPLLFRFLSPEVAQGQHGQHGQQGQQAETNQPDPAPQPAPGADPVYQEPDRAFCEHMLANVSVANSWQLASQLRIALLTIDRLRDVTSEEGGSRSGG